MARSVYYFPTSTGGGGSGEDSDISVVIAFEEINSGQAIHLFDDNGVTRARLADSSVPYEAHGFAITSTLQGEYVPFSTDRAKLSLSGVMAGRTYYVSTSGGITASPPSTTGHIIQRVGYGTNINVLQVEIGESSTIS